MKTLDFNQMEVIEGGSCGWAIAKFGAGFVLSCAAGPLGVVSLALTLAGSIPEIEREC